MLVFQYAFLFLKRLRIEKIIMMFIIRCHKSDQNNDVFDIELRQSIMYNKIIIPSH